MDSNPISLLDKHGWIPALFFGLVNWFRRPEEKGEVLNYRIGSSVLLNSSASGKLNCTWENREIHHLQMVVISFTSKGRKLIENRTVLINCADGEILDVDLNAFPKNENWQIERDAHQVKIPVGVLKPKEEFSVVLFMQHGSKDSISIESRSALKVQGDGTKADFTTYKSGFKHGWIMCSCGFIGGLFLEMARSIQTSHTMHRPELVVAVVVFYIMGYLALANAFLGMAINVWYEDWKGFRLRRKNK
jgi:hypothetical protein